MSRKKGVTERRGKEGGEAREAECGEPRKKDAADGTPRELHFFSPLYAGRSPWDRSRKRRKKQGERKIIMPFFPGLQKTSYLSPPSFTVLLFLDSYSSKAECKRDLHHYTTPHLDGLVDFVIFYFIYFSVKPPASN